MNDLLRNGLSGRVARAVRKVISYYHFTIMRHFLFSLSHPAVDRCVVSALSPGATLGRFRFLARWAVVVAVFLVVCAASEAQATVLRNLSTFLPEVSSACAPDGTFAVLFENGELIELHPDGSETRFFYSRGGIILYDSDGNRHVFIETGGELHHYIYDRLADETSMETVPGWINGKHNIAIGRDNRFRIVWSKWGEPLQYASNESGSWQTRMLVPYNGGYFYVYGVAVDQDGKTHALYGDGRCVYLSNRSGDWQSEIIYTDPVWPDDNSCPTTPYYSDPCLAVFPNGAPVVVARYQQRARTCSYAYVRLVAWRRTAPGSWTAETIADRSDNFYGSDGDHFTGYDACAGVDSQSVLHTVFSDGYLQHAPHQETQIGQIRHATHSGLAWGLHTMFAQQPDPSYTEEIIYTDGEPDVVLKSLLTISSLAVSPFDGSVHVLAQRWPSVANGFSSDLIYVNTFAWDAGCQNLGDGWRRLAWFGDYVPMGGGGWIWHNRHRFIYVSPVSTPGDCWFYTQDMGWLWTSSRTYPFLFRSADQNWLWYNGTTNPRWFVNMRTGVWEMH